MSREFKSEVKTIHLILKGSRWAREPEMPVILEEYKRMSDAGLIQSNEKKVALQILFSSRAIDTFLSMIHKWDCARSGRSIPSYSTIEQSLSYLVTHGVQGRRLDNRTKASLDTNVKDKRNRYLHAAGTFPSWREMQSFISATINGLRVISRL
jgi:hypothetical protein